MLSFQLTMFTFSIGAVRYSQHSSSRDFLEWKVWPIKIGRETLWPLFGWKKLPVLVCLILRFLVGWLILVFCPSEVFISPFLIGKFLRTIGKTETGIQLRSCRRELSEIRDYWLSKPQMFSNLSWRDNMANNKKLNSHCCREKLVSYNYKNINLEHIF